MDKQTLQEIRSRNQLEVYHLCECSYNSGQKLDIEKIDFLIKMNHELDDIEDDMNYYGVDDNGHIDKY